MSQTCLSSLVVLVLCSHACAIELHVPAQYPTIRAAIEAAMDGDTVVLANGVYTGPDNRLINLTGLDVTIRSVNGAATCVIDCESAGNAFFTEYVDNESESVFINGLTLRNGAAPSGGAISAYNGSWVIRNCVFQDNQTTDAQYGSGGAIAGVSGGHFELSDCLFIGNRAGSRGGAAYCNATINRCVFAQNRAFVGGAHVRYSGPAQIRNSVFLNNSADAGGALADGHRASYYSHNCLFLGNQALGWNGSYGGGVILTYSSYAFVNCTMLDNVAPNGAVAYAPLPSMGIEYSNCVLWGNGDWPFYGPTSAFDGQACIVDRDMAGDGIRNIDPRFRDRVGPDGIPATGDEDFRLLAGSPGVDAGVNSVVLSGALDLNGLPRIIDDPMVADGGVGGPPVVDLGAYEFARPCAQAGDADGDGRVDQVDLSTTLAHFGQSKAVILGDGDMDQDGDVDLADLAVVLTYFGHTCR